MYINKVVHEYMSNLRRLFIFSLKKKKSYKLLTSVWFFARRSTAHHRSPSSVMCPECVHSSYSEKFSSENPSYFSALSRGFIDRSRTTRPVYYRGNYKHISYSVPDKILCPGHLRLPYTEMGARKNDTRSHFWHAFTAHRYYTSILLLPVQKHCFNDIEFCSRIATV